MIKQLTFISLGTTLLFSCDTFAVQSKGWKPMAENEKFVITALHKARKEQKEELRSVRKYAPKIVKDSTPEAFDLSAACTTLDQGSLGSCVINAFSGSVHALQTLDIFKKQGGDLQSLQNKTRAKIFETKVEEEKTDPSVIKVANHETIKQTISDYMKWISSSSLRWVSNASPSHPTYHYSSLKTEISTTSPDIEEIKKTIPFYSRLFGYRDVLGMQGDISDTGTDAGTAFLSYQRGWAYEHTYPYNTVKFTQTPTKDAFTEAALNASKVRVNVSLIDVNSLAPAKIEKVISSGKLVLLAMDLFESFESPSVEKTGIVTIPQNHEKRIGGHEMKIVGYDRKAQTFLVNNSWGPKWGINGFCKVPYEMISNPKYTLELMQIKLASD
ncbi:C1 family peptidase [Candidatus Bealeia paramacronuclearis]|uniref:C1 family peptidase n=1 Tax=Candidatus Bealeia paramacronuclearis TaxID=1921001 RepID=A0ABZ2C2D9_9PROT|nr:C1 family peptidase [Candidatus Bealeia paramacronuclearis]